MDKCGHSIQINAFYISSCAFARVEPSRNNDSGGKLPNAKARNRQSKKPAPCELSTTAAARIKVVRLLLIDADSHTWGACGASDAFSFQPHGGPQTKGDLNDVNLSMVLGEFAVRSVLSQWPNLHLELSKSVTAVITGYKEPTVTQLRKLQHIQSNPGPHTTPTHAHLPTYPNPHTPFQPPAAPQPPSNTYSTPSDGFIDVSRFDPCFYDPVIVNR